MKRITRILGILAGVGGALLGILITSSAAFAYEVRPAEVPPPRRRPRSSRAAAWPAGRSP